MWHERSEQMKEQSREEPEATQRERIRNKPSTRRRRSWAPKREQGSAERYERIQRAQAKPVSPIVRGVADEIIKGLLGAPLPSPVLEDEDDDAINANELIPELNSKWSTEIVWSNMCQKVRIKYTDEVQGTWNLGKYYSVAEAVAKAKDIVREVETLDARQPYTPEGRFWEWYNKGYTSHENANSQTVAPLILEDEDDDAINAEDLLAEDTPLVATRNSDPHWRMEARTQHLPNFGGKSTIIWIYYNNTEEATWRLTIDASPLEVLSRLDTLYKNTLIREKACPYDPAAHTFWQWYAAGNLPESVTAKLVNEDEDDDAIDQMDIMPVDPEEELLVRLNAYPDDSSDDRRSRRWCETKLEHDDEEQCYVLFQYSEESEAPLQGKANALYLTHQFAAIEEDSDDRLIIPYDKVTAIDRHDLHNLEICWSCYKADGIVDKGFYEDYLEEERERAWNEDDEINNREPEYTRLSIRTEFINGLIEKFPAYAEKIKEFSAATTWGIQGVKLYAGDAYSMLNEVAKRNKIEWSGADQGEQWIRVDDVLNKVTENTIRHWLNPVPYDQLELEIESCAQVVAQLLEEDEDDDAINQTELVEVDPWPANHTLTQMKRACPLFFARGNARYFGTRGTYKRGNFLILHNVKEFDNYTLTAYVIYEFVPTEYAPKGMLVHRGTVDELDKAERAIQYGEFKGNQP
jgi:hypothetical protein